MPSEQNAAPSEQNAPPSERWAAPPEQNAPPSERWAAPPERDADWDQREIASFEWADQWNGRFVRMLGIGFPVWLWLLLVLGWSGLDPAIGFVLGSFVATVLVVVLEATVFRRAGGRWNDRLVRRALLAMMAAAIVVPLVVAATGLDGGTAALVAVAATLVVGPTLAILATYRPRE